MIRAFRPGGWRAYGESLSSGPRWQNDGALVRACLDGDASAWEALIRRYRRLIFSIPSAYRIPAGDADDIFQRVAVKLFENLARLRKVESLPSWIGVTTRRECLAHIRGTGRLDPIEDVEDSLAQEAPDVAATLAAIQSEQVLTVAFERMDETCRTLLAALYLEDPTPSYKVISERLGRSVGALGPTRSRCLKRLRKLFLELGGEAP